jgi:hypothetical protein
VRRASEAEDAWLAGVATERDDEIIDYTDKGGRDFRYPSHEVAWLGEYEAARLPDGQWQITCTTDGETFVRWDRQRALRECEGHICRGHVTPERATVAVPDEPPF